MEDYILWVKWDSSLESTYSIELKQRPYFQLTENDCVCFREHCGISCAISSVCKEDKMKKMFMCLSITGQKKDREGKSPMTET